MTTQIASPAICPPYGTTPAPPTAPMTSKAICSTRVGEPSAGTSSAPEDAQARATTMNAQGVVTPPMELRNAPIVSALWACPQSRALTPYNAEGWQDLLITLNIAHKFPTLVDQLMHSFCMLAPNITRSFTPPNNPLIYVHRDTFNTILHKEFSKQWYIGPYTQDLLESLIGPFQSLPLSIIPKPGKPGKFHLIQNLSYPNTPRLGEPLSINSQVDPALFPCEWGSFHTTCVLMLALPPGCQGVTRDITKAYCTVPLHPSQWLALMVCITDEPALFAVDTSLCFGYRPSAGTYGLVHDTGLKVLWAASLGPVIAWVDDHLFI